MTLLEATEKGWLHGPCTPAEMDQRFGGNWLPVRRFAVEQKGKLRPIDDLKENRVNETFSSTEKASLYALDHLVWIAIFLARFYQRGGEVNFELGDGTVLSGYVHKDWLEAGVDLKVTAMDLKSAYKQLPLHPCDADKAVISLWCERHQDVRCFECNTLPFGASASVHNFLRVSAFLQAAGCYLGILWTSYFDDFRCTLCPPLPVREASCLCSGSYTQRTSFLLLTTRQRYLASRWTSAVVQVGR